jgi:hypothetical protein
MLPLATGQPFERANADPEAIHARDRLIEKRKILKVKYPSNGPNQCPFLSLF